MNKVKITDIAQKSGVSLTTVSRYFNHPELLSPETQNKIKAAITDLNYSQNNLARILVTGQSNLVGVIDVYKRQVKNSNTAHGGKNIGYKGSSVLFYICKGKPQKQSPTHMSHRLSLILSMCQKSSDTFPALFLCLCKSDEIPPHP